MFARRFRANPRDRNADELHRLHRLIAVQRRMADRVHHLHPRHNLAENRILLVPTPNQIVGDEELAASRVRRAAVGHGEASRAIELQSQLRLVGNRDSAIVRAAASGVARLDHLSAQHPVKRDVVVHWPLHHGASLRFAPCLGTLRQPHEILHGRGSDFFIELRDDGPLRCVESGVEPWLRRNRRLLG